MKKIHINIPKTDQKRVVIVGGGFAGLSLAKRLANTSFQVVLLDKNNFHQFQPLFYQVAMSGLEPSSIAFPLRKLFQKKNNVFIRVAEVEAVDYEEQEVITSIGSLEYDYLVLAHGAKTNFFGNEAVSKQALPMKSVSEALYLRNEILMDYEKAIITEDYDQRQGLIDIVIVGGGPTGVEIAGALAEMKKFILPKDYTELNAKEVDIYLIEGADRLLGSMSEKSSQKAEDFLRGLGVIVKKNLFVTDYDGKFVELQNGEKIRSNKVIWAAGIVCNKIDGLPEDIYVSNERIRVNDYLQVDGVPNIFAIGDIAYLESDPFPKGHPQVAQTAIQQGKHMAVNLKRALKDKEWKSFEYIDKGSMATIGRNKAVVDLPKFSFAGFFAWIVWLFVHLYALIGTRNKVVVFFNWVWNYFTYDQALRLIIRPKIPEGARKEEKKKVS